MDENPFQDPFPDLEITSSEFLDQLSGRSFCPKCGCSRKFFCYTCHIPVAELKNKLPKVKLPVKIDIIKHARECDGKSTAVHAGILAPEDVTIYTYPVIPDYKDKSKVILIFPGKEAVRLEQLANQGSCEQACDSSTANQKTCEQACDLSASELSTEPCRKAQRLDGENHLGTCAGDLTEPKTCGGQTCQQDKQTNQTETEDSPILSGDCNRVSETNSLGKAAGQESHSQETVDGTSQGDQSKVEKDAADIKEEKNMKRTIDEVTEASTQRKGTAPFDTAVFIDCTWAQTTKIYLDERLKGLQQVELTTKKTIFWRPQKGKPDTYLATIEAVYYFLREYHELFVDSAYDGKYDNLLFFFQYMHKQIRIQYNKIASMARPSRNQIKQ